MQWHLRKQAGSTLEASKASVWWIAAEGEKVLWRCGGSFRDQVRMCKSQGKNAQALAGIEKKQEREKKKREELHFSELLRKAGRFCTAMHWKLSEWPREAGIQKGKFSASLRGP